VPWPSNQKVQSEDDAYRRLDGEWQQVGLEIQSMGRVRASTRAVDETRTLRDARLAEVNRFKDEVRATDLNREIREADRGLKEVRMESLALK